METLIKPLTNVSMDTLYHTWSLAFDGYAHTWTRAALQNDLTRRGYVPQLSFGAFDGDALVGFTLNAIGGFNGRHTAYDTGTGTIPAYRGKGLATHIFTTALPHLRAHGVQQYLLEVLQDNAAAVSVYSKLGFTVSRGFNYFMQDNEALSLNDKALPAGIVLSPIGMEWEEELNTLCDHAHAWQNSFDAIKRMPKEFAMLGAFAGDTLIGYGILQKASGDVTQLAVNKHYRRRGIGSALLKGLLAHNSHKGVKVINTVETDDGIVSFLSSHGIPLKGRQYEMVYAL